MVTEPLEHPASAANDALHVPVLKEICVDLLAPALGGQATLIDCTLGMGGHSEAFLEHFPELTVVGIDRDPEAIRLASQRLSRFGERFIAVHNTYDAVAEVAQEYGVNAILMDLGVSSLQLDQVDRGFSYSQDAPLDMRMDASPENSDQTAAELLNTASVGEIARILRVYGEEKFAHRIAQELVRRREDEPFRRTAQLVDAIDVAMPAAGRRTGGNPAKRTFQALRIAVNNELDVLERAIDRAVEALPVGGRIAVESYQSLEDRIVKEAFNRGLKSTTPPGLPVELEDHKPYLRALTRGALKADSAEISRNPRSASVRLRAVERVRLTPAHLLTQGRRS